LHLRVKFVWREDLALDDFGQVRGDPRVQPRAGMKAVDAISSGCIRPSMGT